MSLLFACGAFPTDVCAQGGLDPDPATWPAVAEDTRSVALGDVDGDGDLDVVCGNDQVRTSLYRNDGGGFTSVPVWTSPTVEHTYSVALGDVDGDGDLDLLCGNRYSAAPTTLYRNDGGSFTQTPVWSAGDSTGGTVSVAFGDVDSDGDLDFVCGKFLGPPGTSNVLYRNDNGAFTPIPVGPPTSTGFGDYCVAFGDVDGDGDLDLILGNDWFRPNALYRNDDGTFSQTPAWSASTTQSTCSVALGDIDGDGDLDLVCGNHNDNEPSTEYRNDGGVFTTAPVWSTSLGHWTTSVALGDVDGDGDLDLAMGIETFSPDALYRNDGGVLTATPAWSGAVDEGTRAAAFADVDGDGDLDLVCGNSEPNALHWNNGQLLTEDCVWGHRYPNPATNSMALGDVDDDGDLDLVCGGESHWTNRLYRNDGGVLTTDYVWFSDEGTLIPRTSSVALGDIDGDHDPDLVCGCTFSPNTMYRNVGGVFTPSPAWSSVSNGNTASLALADVDGDGDLDLACAGPDSCTLYRNDGGRFTLGPVWSSADGASTYSLALGDVDGDGDPDLVGGGTRLKLYRNDRGVFTSNPAWSSNAGYGADVVTLGDVDGDGDVDLACGSYYQPDALYRNDGGLFTGAPVWSTAGAGNTVVVALGDADADGDLDLVCGNGGASAVYRNDGGAFTPTPIWSSTSGLSFYSAVALGDVDEDGDLDLVCGTESGDGMYAGLRAPAYKGNAAAPSNHLTNNGAYLRWVRCEPADLNTIRVTFRAVDVESDPVWVVADYQFLGAPAWAPLQAVGSLGPLTSSPQGDAHEFDWDVSRFPADGRDVVLRLRTISNPMHVGVIQHLPAYFQAVGRVVPRRPELLAGGPLNFPTPVTLGDTVAVPLVLTNVGNEPLSVSAITLPTSAMRISRGMPFTISPGSVDTTTVYLEPRVETTFSGSLVVHSNDPLNPTVTVGIGGTVLGLTGTTTALVVGRDAPLGEALTIQLIPDPGVNVERGSLLSRAPGGPAFTSVELTSLGGGFIGVVPGEAVTERGLEYYVQMENSGILRTDPPGAPSDSVFFQAVAAPAELISTALVGPDGRYLLGRGITVQMGLPQGAEFLGGTLHFRRGGEAEFAATPIQMGPQLPEGTIAESFVGPRGVEYWLEVQTATRLLRDPPTAGTLRERPIRVTVPSLSEDQASPGGRYRMISIPLDFGTFGGTVEALLSDEGEFGTYDPTRWRLFRYLPGRGASVEFSDSEAAAFRPEAGRGFWLISRAQHQMDTAPVEALSTRTDAPANIVLDPGWNQIGDPFAFPVAWATVERPPSVGEVYAFDPSANAYREETASVLQPFEAYFVRNVSAAPETLRVPPIAAGAGTALATSGPRAAEAAWQLQLEAACGPGGAASIVVGEHPAASIELDALDRESPPPPPGAAVRFAVSNRDWKQRPGLYRRDYRAPAEGHVFLLEAQTQTAGAAVSLKPAELSIPEDLAIRLIDLEQSVPVDLRGESGYSFLGFGLERPYRLTLLVGTEAFVADEQAKRIEVPAGLVLDHNSPNPFETSTRLRFGLPAPGRADLAIYDLSGRRVATLVEGRQLPAGYHAVLWNGRDTGGRRVASGVYFYRLEAAGTHRAGKMVVLR